MTPQRPSTVNFRSDLFEASKAIIEREYGSDLELDTIAHRTLSSRRQLQRAFAEVGNTTFRKCLYEVRMRKAAELLRQQDLPVAAIARRVAYRQPAQFAKAFKRYSGKTPTAFRDQNLLDT